VRFGGFLPAKLDSELAGARRVHVERRGALMVVLDEAAASARVPSRTKVSPDPPARKKFPERLDAGVCEFCCTHAAPRPPFVKTL